MTIQIIYAEIFHSVLRKIPGHIVDGWLCDLEGRLVFKIQAMIVYPAEFHLQTLPSSETGALFSLSLTFPSLLVAPEMLLPK